MSTTTTVSSQRHFLALLIHILILFLPFVSYGQLPSTFQKVELLTGLKNSVNMEFAPDGRIFILDRYGEMIIYKPATQTSVSAGTLEVFHDMEDGLLGIAFDPQFTTNNFIYLNYSAPNLPKNRVSRFKMNGDKLDLSSEVVVLEWTADRNGYYHSSGDLDFDSKGNLYIATGDNTNHSSYATLNEVDKDQSSERTSSNTNDLRGKILRIKPEANGTYSIPAGNLFPNGDGGRPEIYVMGARNPFRIFVDKTNTDWLFWGEVGPDANAESNLGPEGMDEINLVKGAGNYGWPYFSGKNEAYLNTYAEPNFYYDQTNPVNLSKWNTGAKFLPPAQPSWLEFFHKCYLAGPRYYYNPNINNPKKLPSDFNQAFFYYDFNESKIWVVKMDNNGNIVSNQQFAPNVIKGSGFIELKIGPDGQLYILEYGAGCCPGNTGTGKLVRVDFTGIDSNKSPLVSLSANVTSGQLPLTVNFSSEGTSDPDGDALTYQWDFQSDGVIDSNVKNPSFTYTVKGIFNAQVRVTDARGALSSKSIQIHAGNTAATFQFKTPIDGGLISWGDDINYDIGITDQEDGSTANGTVSCSSLHLIPSFGHLGHSHDGLTINQCKGTFNLNPEGHDAQGQDDIYYVFKVNYTDKGGLTSFDQATVHPKLKEAEFYSAQSNTKLMDNTDKLGGGLYSVRALGHNAHLVLAGRNLTNISSVIYRVAATLGGTIEIHVGSPTGALISTATIPSTGNFNTWVNVEAPVTNPGGKNDLYFVFKRNAGDVNLFDVNYIEFIGAGVSIDKTPPNIYSIVAPNPTQINVKFNEPLDAASAQLVANYAINNGVTISSATLQQDRKTVILKTTNLIVGVDNELTVSNLKNETGVTLTQSISKTFRLEEALVRINAGGPRVDVNGVTWSQSQYNTGGSTYAKANLPINNTTADVIYQTELFGNMTFNIPVPQSGVYNVALHFAELYHGVDNTNGIGSRIFNVTVENGQGSLNNYDIIQRAGGAATAAIENFYGLRVDDGFVTITFTGVKDQAKVSAIEVSYGKETVPEPSISILKPVDNATVTPSFTLTMEVKNWEVGEGTTHIHKFLDGVDKGEVYSTGPITYSNLPVGPHTIKLTLMNADHTPTAYSDEVAVNVIAEAVCEDVPFPTSWAERTIGTEVPYRSPYIYSADIDKDGLKDVVTGAWWYKNPGTATGTWVQKAIGAPMNNMVLIHDFDKDGDPDIFGTQGTYISAKMAWAQNDGKGNFTIHTNIPDGTSTYSETFIAGAALGNFNGVTNTQIAIVWNGAESSHSPVQMLTVPANPVSEAWTIRSISPNAVGESISAGDIDRDGDLDLFQGANWLRNDNGSWTTFSTGINLPTFFDRNALADLNKDGILDAVVTQIGSNQEVSWFVPPADPTQTWTKRTIGTDVDGGLSLDVVDIDFDGDLDITTGEWQEAHRLIAFENDLCNTGTWIKHILHPGGTTAPDHHDSAITVDIDNDGDLDMLSMGWDKRIPRIYINNGTGTTTNVPPTVAIAIPDQTTTTGANYSYTFPAGTFTDPNNDPLTYTAALTTGAALPGWLAFNATTRTFSGTAPTTAATYAIRVTANDGKGGTATDDFSLAVQTGTGGGGTTVRINAGGTQVTAANGDVFNADQYFGAGEAFTNTQIVDIAGTSDDALYRSERYGSFSYNIPVTSGTYRLRLHFAEIYFGAAGGGAGGNGKRVFNVTAEGQTILSNFDIYAQVGAMTALVREFQVNVTDGTLNVALSSVVEHPKISAIEVIPAAGTVNQPPVLAAAIPDQSATVGTAYSYSFPTGTFTDPNNDPLTYTATLTTGAALPAWLAFTGGTRTFSGTPPTGSTGTYAIRVTASDGKGGTATDDFSLTVQAGTQVNQPPTVAAAIPDQTTTTSAAYSYTFPAGTFTDPNNDALTYTAALTSGAALPGWLAFNATTRTFSGTAPTTAATYAIRVTANDGKGGTATDDFSLAVQTGTGGGGTTVRINSGGSAATTSLGAFVADQSFTGGTAFTNTKIADIGGTTDDVIYLSERYGALSYNIPVTSGTYRLRLHFAELYFGATGGGTGGNGKRVFNVTAEGQTILSNFDIYAQVGAMNALVREFQVTVTDGMLNLALVQVIENPNISAIEVIPAAGTVNQPPTVAAAIPDQSATVGTAYSYSFPAGTFTDPNSDALTYTAALTTGAALPAWLAFTGGTRTFSGTPPTGSTGTYAIRVTASDGKGGTATDDFSLTVQAGTQVNQPPVVSIPIPDQTTTTGANYSYTFPAGTFTDPNNDPLTYTAIRGNGNALPTWLTFNGATRTFSGKAPATAVSLNIQVTASDGKGGTVFDTFNLSVQAPSGGTTVRINAGGPAATTSMGAFSADQYAAGGSTYTNTQISDIGGTTDDVIYRSERYGALSYNIPVTSGTYRLRLHFAELYFGATGGGPGGNGKRVFNVTAEGQTILSNFDIYAQAGAMNALVREFQVTVTDGTLNLALVKVIENPKISAIEVLPATTTTTTLASQAINSKTNKLAVDVEKAVSAFPNPFESSINLRIKAEEPQVYHIRVYDALSRTIYQSKVTSNAKEATLYSIDLAKKSLKAGGLYFIHVESKSISYKEVFKMVKGQ
ncbi:malectin domain-containing carbohydrate-binding protein [Sabulibacter ruber]|uniref:malectin domain-containing carbohydrate-binding protein n=1 Tax=Sabulibacter ruber TaxID=2811901 RepID=UPI002418614E|nr:malectin domain-containing carbohydrate-binding protein [Sabulibacter ruber]